MESLVLAVAGDLTAFGGTQKSVMSKLHEGKWVIQPLAAPPPPVARRGSWRWEAPRARGLANVKAPSVGPLRHADHLPPEGRRRAALRSRFRTADGCRLRTDQITDGSPPSGR